MATIAWQKDPDIDVFYGNIDEMAIGAALAGEQLGKTINKDFFAVGIDGNQPTLDLLKQGKFSATLGVDPVRMGETVIDTMQKVLTGEKVPADPADPVGRGDAGQPGRTTWPASCGLSRSPGRTETDNDKPTVPDEGGTALPRPLALPRKLRRLRAARVDLARSTWRWSTARPPAARSSAGSWTCRPRPAKATSRPS